MLVVVIHGAAVSGCASRVNKQRGVIGMTMDGGAAGGDWNYSISLVPDARISQWASEY